METTELKLLGAYKQVNSETGIPFLSYSLATRRRDADGRKENVVGSLGANEPLLLSAANPELAKQTRDIVRRLRSDEAKDGDLELLDKTFDDEVDTASVNMGCWFLASNLEWVAQTETRDPDGYGERVMDKRSKRGDRVGNFERESLTQPITLKYAGEGGGISVDMTGAPGVL